MTSTKTGEKADKPTQTTGELPHGSDEHMGAVEGDRVDDQRNEGNPHGPGIDSDGLPNDPIATSEDALGANVDGSEGG
jgi:hypothetical protein